MPAEGQQTIRAGTAGVEALHARGQLQAAPRWRRAAWRGWPPACGRSAPQTFLQWGQSQQPAVAAYPARLSALLQQGRQGANRTKTDWDRAQRGECSQPCAALPASWAACTRVCRPRTRHHLLVLFAAGRFFLRREGVFFSGPRNRVWEKLLLRPGSTRAWAGRVHDG